MPDYSVRQIRDDDREWIVRFTTKYWGSDQMIAHGESFYISKLPGFLAEMDGEPVGLATYQIKGGACEITSLNSMREGIGIGGALIEAVRGIAQTAGCIRLFLITTNDNISALRFYQRHGFALAALRRDAVTESRKIKPEIPLIGANGIPLRDELELEIWLT